MSSATKFARESKVFDFAFPAGETTSSAKAEFASFAFCNVHLTENLVGRTLLFFDHGEWGKNQILQVTAAGKFLVLDSEQIAPLAGSNLLTVELDQSVVGDSTVWISAKT